MTIKRRHTEELPEHPDFLWKNPSPKKSYDVIVIGAGGHGLATAYYGHSVGAPLAYAWLPIEHSKIGTKVEIQYFDKLVKAKVGNDPQFDPDMTRLKS